MRQGGMLFVNWPNVAEALCFPYRLGLLAPAQQVKGSPDYGQQT